LNLIDQHPDNTGLVGYLSIIGANSGQTLIMFEPTLATDEAAVTEIGATAMKTWLTIGTVGKQCQFLVIRNLTVGSTDTTYQKRAFHIIDSRAGVFENLTTGA